MDSVSAGINDDPAWGRDLLRRLGAEELTGHRLRRVSDDQGCHPMLDWQLDLRPIGFARNCVVRGRGWHGARRRRSNSNAGDKVRWSRTLRPKPKAPAAPPRATPAALPDWARIGDTDPGPSWSAPLG